MKERRQFIRHPISHPIEFEVLPHEQGERTKTLDVSEGGLLFLSKQNINPGKIIVLKMPFQDKLFKVHARVAHTEKDAENPNLYSIGVAFYRYSDAFKVKLIEQIYLIDEYRSLRSIQLGREVSLREASEDWISRYSERFDRLFWGA